MITFDADPIDPTRPVATFLAHGPDGPMYHVVGGPHHGTTLHAAGLMAEKIPVPETPAFDGQRLSGDQLRERAIAAREIQQLRDALRAAERAADTDVLTGLANRRALDRALPTAEADLDLSVIVFDVNNFGHVNKVRGQLAGDDVLIDVATAIHQAATEAGPNARVFRRGGDEFVVLAPTTVAPQLRHRAERLFGNQAIGGMDITLTGTVAGTFQGADAKLQAAKRARKADPNDTNHNLHVSALNLDGTTGNDLTRTSH